MFSTLRHTALFLVTAVLVALTVPGVAVAQQPTAAERSYTSAARARAQLVDRLETLEKDYQRIVRRIEERKRAGAMDTFAGKLELQNLLSEARALSDKLGKLQDDVRDLDRRLDAQRENVLAGIDAKVTSLEQKLRRAPAGDRRAIVAELNALRQRRSQYSAPLPDAPSLSEVKDALSLAEEVDPNQPEELEAAADELEDTEDQIRRRLDAVRSRLDELNRRKRLQRRDAQFKRENRIWGDEEQARSNRDIARVNRTNNNGGGNAAGDDGAGEEQGPNEPTVVNDGDQTAAPSAGGAGNNDNGQEGAGFDLSSGESDAPVNRAPDFTDSPDSPEQAPPSSGDDPFAGGGGGTVVIAAGADPTLAVGSEPRNIVEVSAAIDELKEEEARLSNQANELEQKAKKLRKKAQSLR